MSLPNPKSVESSPMCIRLQTIQQSEELGKGVTQTFGGTQAVATSVCVSLGKCFGTWSYSPSGSRRLVSTTCPPSSNGQKVLRNRFVGSYFRLVSTSLSQLLPKQA